MSWTLVLPWSKAPYGLSANHRPHWAVKAKETARVRSIVGWLARKQQIPTMKRMQVELVWVVKDRRKRDSDNLLPLLKAVCDGLASDRGESVHLVPDDDPEHCVKLMPRIEYRAGVEPHFEVIITDLEER